MKTHKVYLAGPLFSIAERTFNERLTDALHTRMTNLEFILPQEKARTLEGQEGFAERMFEYCIGSIDEADALLCILDGPDVDSGTSIEMGYAYKCRKPIIAVRTDSRSSEEHGVNLVVSRVCSELIWQPSSDTTVEELAEQLVAALNRVLA